MLPVVPVAKGRPRFSRFGHAFTPKKTRDAEAEIRRLMQKRWLHEPLGGPVEIEARFYMPIPKSWSKKKREASYGAWHTSKPDIDNAGKILFDSIIGIIIKDDTQIARALLSKKYDGFPRIEMIVTQL